MAKAEHKDLSWHDASLILTLTLQFSIEDAAVLMGKAARHPGKPQKHKGVTILLKDDKYRIAN